MKFPFNFHKLPSLYKNNSLGLCIIWSLRLARCNEDIPDNLTVRHSFSVCNFKLESSGNYYIYVPYSFGNVGNLLLFFNLVCKGVCSPSFDPYVLFTASSWIPFHPAIALHPCQHMLIASLSCPKFKLIFFVTEIFTTISFGSFYQRNLQKLPKHHTK